MARMGIDIVVTGNKKIAQNLKRMNGRAEKALGAGLYGVGNNIMTQSKRQTPVDTGTLKGSGYVTLPQKDRGTLVVELGYGGPAKEYAVYVHERLDLRHPEGGEAKFLEKSINEVRATFTADVAAIARRAFEQEGEAIKNPGMPENPWEGGPEK